MQLKNGQTKIDKRRHTYGEQAHEKMLSTLSALRKIKATMTSHLTLINKKISVGEGV